MADAVHAWVRVKTGWEPSWCPMQSVEINHCGWLHKEVNEIPFRNQSGFCCPWLSLALSRTGGFINQTTQLFRFFHLALILPSWDQFDVNNLRLVRIFNEFCKRISDGLTSPKQNLISQISCFRTIHQRNSSAPLAGQVQNMSWGASKHPAEQQPILEEQGQDPHRSQRLFMSRAVKLFTSGFPRPLRPTKTQGKTTAKEDLGKSEFS